jgi:hypothetical protein
LSVVGCRLSLSLSLLLFCCFVVFVPIKATTPGLSPIKLSIHSQSKAQIYITPTPEELVNIFLNSQNINTHYGTPVHQWCHQAP